MPTQGPSGKPTTRRYSDAEKKQAVRLVRQLRAELGTDHGTVQRVADQLGYGVESVRMWVRQDEIDRGDAPGRRLRTRIGSRRSHKSFGSCGAPTRF